MTADHEEIDLGAKAALSGFRRQALYTLSLLIQEAENDGVVQPEGKEDIALFKGDTLVRVIQVKAYSDPLRLSDLKPERSRSFLHRTKVYLGSETVVELASFGPLGPEFAKWKNQEADGLRSLKKKLERHGFSSDQADKTLAKITISCPNEETVEKEAFDFLRSTLTSGNPERAFELLNWWILKASEERRKITFTDLRKQLVTLGRYFAERQSHHDEWFKTIKPLDGSGTATESTDLAEEYYKGTAARFSHIEAGLDIRRSELLEKIDQNFQAGKRVVILHGASGQGKTSLGFRYLLDYVPDEWRFLVDAIDDRKHAATIAMALADHLQTVDCPVYLLIDVAPRDQEWVSLVRELLDAPNIHMLVAIREEDLARRPDSESQLGFPANVPLQFSIAEAQSIYERLLVRGHAVNAFPSFSEAWDRFGGKGPLLEFVYLVTQTQSLRAVLQAQVARLREEIRSGHLEKNVLRFLKLCAISTAYEARILLRPTIELLQINDPVGTLNLFEDEYLLRVSSDRSQAESLHPVRSAILMDVLDDPTFSPTEELACEVLPLIPEDDREVFLLYLFSRHPESAGGVLAQLPSLKVTSWASVAGIARTLLWWGITSYLNANQPVFKRAKSVKELSDAWSLFLLSDLAKAGEGDPFDAMIRIIGEKNPQGAQQILELRTDLSDPIAIYSFLADWIGRVAIETLPTSAVAWKSWAEVLFWAGRLEIVPGWPIGDIEKIPISNLPIEISAQICQALFIADRDLYDQLLLKHGDQIKKRFQEETRTFRLDEGDELFAHFVVPWEQLVDRSHGAGLTSEAPEKTVKKKLDAILNDEAVYRASLLRLMFPGKERYCTQGYGQRFNLGEGDFLAQISHKTMPESALPLQWLVQINSTTQNLVKYTDRPENWREYADRLLNIREKVASVLLKLERRLSAYFKSKKPRQIVGGNLSEGEWQEARELAGARVLFPRTAVDEWGLSSEGQQRAQEGQQRARPSQKGKSMSLASSFTTQNQEVLTKPLERYQTTAKNFLKDAWLICFFHAAWGREPLRRQEFEKAFEQHGYNEHQVHLAKHNLFLLMQSLRDMQRGFNERLESLVDSEKLEAVNNREASLFPGLWALWYQFCEQPDRRIGNAKHRAQSAFEEERRQLKSIIKNALANGQGWKARVLHEDFRWENQRSLVIELQLSSVFKLEECRLSLLEALGSVLSGLENGTLSRYALDYSWQQLIVIPTYRGQAIEAIAWFIPSFVFFSTTENESFDRSHIRIPLPFPEEQLAELGLTIGGEQLGEQYDVAKEGFGRWMVMLNHMASLAAVPDGIEGIDEIGESVLNSYLSDLSAELSSLTTKTLNAADTALEEVQVVLAINSTAGGEITLEIEEALEMIKEDISSGSLSLSDCASLSEKVAQFSGLWGLLRWITIPGAIEDLHALQEAEMS